MPAVHPETIVDGVTVDHNEIHEDYSKAWNRREKVVPCVTDGTTDNTAIIQDAHDDATPGDVLVFPRGSIVTDPITFAKCLHLRGAGRFSTRFVPRSNTTSPLVTFDITIDSGFGIYDNFGPSMDGIGINRLGHMAGPCLHVADSVEAFSGHRLLTSGGTRSVELRGGNPTLDDVRLWDASDCMVHMVDGLEGHFSRVRMAAQVRACDAYWKVILATGGGPRGAIYIHPGCTGNAVATVSNGMIVTAPSLTELPIFSEGLILDNVVGGGPCLTLTNIQTASFTGGWMNGSNGCVKLDGCNYPFFSLNRYRGGTHTYEFGTTAQTVGFQSIGNEVPTTPAYKVGTTNKPVYIETDDLLTGATAIGQVTNDPAWFENASRRSWGQRRFQGHLRRRESGAAPPAGYVVLSGGIATVNHPLVGTNTRIRVWHERPGSSPGIIYSSVADNIAGTSFKIRSTSGADNAGVYWEFVGDAD